MLVWYLLSCASAWSVCEVVLVPYVDVVTVMLVLFVLHVCMLRECEGVTVPVMLVWGTGGWGECGVCVYGWNAWCRCCV